MSEIREDGTTRRRLKGGSVRKLRRAHAMEHLQIHVSRKNLTLRVDKRSLCRNSIFPDECKHRSECARSKERRLCAVTSSSPSYVLAPAGKRKYYNIFLKLGKYSPDKRDVTIFARLCKLKYKSEFAPSFRATRIMQISRFNVCARAYVLRTCMSFKFNYIMQIRPG